MRRAFVVLAGLLMLGLAAQFFFAALAGRGAADWKSTVARLGRRAPG